MTPGRCSLRRAAAVMLSLAACCAAVEATIGLRAPGRLGEEAVLIAFVLGALLTLVVARRFMLRRRLRATPDAATHKAQFRSAVLNGWGIAVVGADSLRVEAIEAGTNWAPAALVLVRLVILDRVLPAAPLAALLEGVLSLLAGYLLFSPPTVEAAYGAVRRVEDRPAALRFVFATAEGELAVDAAPPDYASRGRLLQDLALRCPASLERGIEALAAERARREAALGAGAPEREPFVPAVTRDPSDPPLATVIADIEERRKSAIPRSPLGCGLFAPPAGGEPPTGPG